MTQRRGHHCSLLAPKAGSARQLSHAGKVPRRGNILRVMAAVPMYVVHGTDNVRGIEHVRALASSGNLAVFCGGYRNNDPTSSFASTFPKFLFMETECGEFTRCPSALK
jgi:hypothetical protein